MRAADAGVIGPTWPALGRCELEPGIALASGLLRGEFPHYPADWGVALGELIVFSPQDGSRRPCTFIEGVVRTAGAELGVFLRSKACRPIAGRHSALGWNTAQLHPYITTFSAAQGVNSIFSGTGPQKAYILRYPRNLDTAPR
jgi:hypothetical protein